MRVRVAGLVAAFVIVSCVHAPRSVDLAIRHITIIDGTGRAPFVGDVLVHRGRVIAVGDAEDAIAATEVDGTGRFLIPGLIDMHVHVSSFQPRPEAFALLLEAGVTTVRDMGGDTATLTRWRTELQNGELQGPELLIVGSTLNGEQVAPFHRVIDRPEDAATAVAEMADAGAVAIKVHNALSSETLSAIIDAARVRGLDVVGHVPPGPGPLSVCQAGMKELSHASALLESMLWRAEQPPADLVGALNELNGPQSNALWACMQRTGMAFAPNLSMYNPIIDALSEPQAGMTRRLVGALGQIALRAQGSGVLIIAGTDSNGDDEHPPFGVGLHQEMRALVDAGFTPMQALSAATFNAAQHLHRQGDIGVIAAGAQADFVVLCADPLADISNTEAIGVVISNGLLAQLSGNRCPR